MRYLDFLKSRQIHNSWPRMAAHGSAATSNMCEISENRMHVTPPAPEVRPHRERARRVCVRALLVLISLSALPQRDGRDPP
mmetsp:Transcript_47084/g.106162  ORF Transcript_47084/g.106162 Transcript_47084/m.106162 type:complete len:81 (-) Transcript_47084:276-518(-)